MARKRKELCSRKKVHFEEEFVWHLLAGLWMLGIFILSDIAGAPRTEFDLALLIERKGAHIFEFFVLAYLFWKIFSFYLLKHSQRIWLTFLFSLLYASWDEVHQLSVAGREGKLSDIAIDMLGVILFLIVLYLFNKCKLNKTAPT